MTDPTSPGEQTIRLIFEYEGDTVRLVSQQPVDVTLPGPPQTDQLAAHFVETRDDAGGVLSRVAVRGGFQQSSEVFPEDHSESITRVDTEPQGAFTVLVPVQAEAVRVAVVRAAPIDSTPRVGGAAPAPGESAGVELGSFPLEGRG